MKQARQATDEFGGNPERKTKPEYSDSSEILNSCGVKASEYESKGQKNETEIRHEFVPYWFGSRRIIHR